MRSISILGATGSVGEQTLDLVRRNPAEWNVVALTANSNVAALAASAREFGAQVAVVADESRLGELRDALAGSGIEAAAGRGALCEAASRPVDMTVAAIVGCAGLGPVMARSRPVAARCERWMTFPRSRPNRRLRILTGTWAPRSASTARRCSTRASN
jgi:1-deoxy-D-xylulose 5-phosphate reductoisomerase